MPDLRKFDDSRLVHFFDPKAPRPKAKPWERTMLCGASTIGEETVLGHVNCYECRQEVERIDKRPAYVKAMDLELKKAQAELRGLQEVLQELRHYVNSSKFRDPSDRQFYVHTDDVLLRLNEAGYYGQACADAVQQGLPNL